MGMQADGKVVLVTGANRGIGLAIVEEALRRGAKKVYAAVRRIETARPLVEQHGNVVVPLHVDLQQPETIASAAEHASDVDIVVNNAGVLKPKSALEADAVDTLEFEMSVNVYGLMRVARAFAPILKANGGGALVQLNSVASLLSFPDFATYCASKAASYSITQALYHTLKNQQTQVLSVHPGPIATDMAREAGFEQTSAGPEVVAKALFDALAEGQFLLFPDPFAQQIGAAYEGFAHNVVIPGVGEG
ncbi:MAG: short-chain dehydrogenase [Pirellulaceae bacterium]|nr:MAG: short-chain dehydrogenase [Pirellulaceae bacterium]